MTRQGLEEKNHLSVARFVAASFVLCAVAAWWRGARPSRSNCPRFLDRDPLSGPSSSFSLLHLCHPPSPPAFALVHDSRSRIARSRPTPEMRAKSVSLSTSSSPWKDGPSPPPLRPKTLAKATSLADLRDGLKKPKWLQLRKRASKAAVDDDDDDFGCAGEEHELAEGDEDSEGELEGVAMVRSCGPCLCPRACLGRSPSERARRAAISGPEVLTLRFLSRTHRKRLRQIGRAHV